jgi:class 3 adenylate cyclase/streptogramin lyase
VHAATSATATFLFTDIAGSTQLLKTHRADYAAILADHHRLLRAAFAAHGGREVDNQGDAFFVAFTRAREALLAAAASQRALASHRWPGGASVRVRMGIHTGEADVASDRYVGLSVHRAARISALGHGGQVLVSATTAGLVEDEEEQLPGLALRDLGEQWLKDLERPVRLYQLDVDGLPTRFAPLKSTRPPASGRGRRGVLAAAGAVVLAAGLAALAFALRSDNAPPEVLPNSLVRFDPETLEPTDVFPIGGGADLVVVSGGYVWTTHYLLRDAESVELRDAGDRTLTRVDPGTGETVTVGGGLAPCGLTADPSGDVWVANCYAAGGPAANVVRIDAESLDFEATWPVPAAEGYFRGLVYGGGSLWVSGVAGAGDLDFVITQLDPQTGKRRPIEIPVPGATLAWSEGYGDLWISNFAAAAMTRMHPSSGASYVVDRVGLYPAASVVEGDVVWVGDWARLAVMRLRALGRSTPRTLRLPGHAQDAGVWSVAAGAGHIWAVAPRDGALWRIDERTNAVTRIDVPHFPTGVAGTEEEVWVTVRGDEP